MEEYASLLKEQLQRHLGEGFVPSGALKDLFDTINLTYRRLQDGEVPPVTRALPGTVRESESSFRSLFGATFEGIMIHSQGIILDVNQAALEMMGYQREEVLGMDAFQLVAEAYREKVAASLRQESIEPYEIMLLRKDGTHIYAEIRGKNHLFEGNMVRLVALRDITRRKQDEEEIGRQRAFLSQVLDSLPIHVFLKDKIGRFVFVNRYACEQHGFEASQVIGKSDFEIFDNQTLAATFVADDQEVWLRQQLIVKEEKSELLGKTHAMLTGKTIIHRTNSLIREKDASPDESLLLGYALDITDRFRMEEELRAKEHFIRQVLDADPSPIYVRDREGRFLMVNQAFADLVNLSKEAALEHYNSAAYAADPAYGHFRKMDQEVIEQRQLLPSEDAYKRADGEMRYFQTTRKPLRASDNAVHVLSISVDITEQRKALTYLQASEASYRQIVESANDMIYRCDAYGNCVYVNPVSCRVLGYSEAELLKMHFSEVVHEAHRPAVIDFYRNQFASRIPDTYFEFLADSQDGKPIWVGQSVHMLLDGSGGRIVGFQAVARDITERKKVEQELLLAMQAAEESAKSKEQFLSVMSHELRTPLNAVIGLTHLLLEQQASEGQKEYLSAIQYSADTLMLLINDILDFSKIESGKVSFEQASFELDSVLRGIRQSFGFEAADKNIKLLFNTEGKLPEQIIGDPVRLNQILTNLVSNALKFTAKGYVEVGLEVLSEQEETITIQFSVTDTGIGIPPEKAHVIFESFIQASSETTRKYGGSGLGLSITKQLVELQGGQIGVQSKLGMGSKFSFWLTFGKYSSDLAARLPVQSLRKLGSTRTDYSQLKGACVLLVEDNKMNQLVASEFLRKWGISADIAADGYEALEKLKKNRYELILMDLQMPGLDGFETARHIRNQLLSPWKDVPILALTASMLPEVKYKALSAGMDDLIAKPFDPQELQNKLLRYIPIKPVNARETSVENPWKGSTRFKIINLDYLESASIHHTQFVEEMIRVFLRQTPEFILRAREACGKADWTTFSAIIHKMKATTATVGISSLVPVFERLTSTLHPKEPVGHEIGALMDEVAGICNEAFQELEESLALLEGQP